MKNFDKYKFGVPTNIFSSQMKDGTVYPDHIPDDDLRPLRFLSEYNKYRKKQWQEVTILDLGAAEGSSSFMLASTGANIVSIEGRLDCVLRARFVAADVGFRNIAFLHGNVLDESLWRKVDIVYASGILYHLENPLKLIELICEYALDAVYFCTHYAPSDNFELKQSIFYQSGVLKNPRFLMRNNRENVFCMDYLEPSDLTEFHDKGRRHPRSGINNSTSLWLGREDLKSIIQDCGFPCTVDIDINSENLRTQIAFFREYKQDNFPDWLPSLPWDKSSIKHSSAISILNDVHYLKSMRNLKIALFVDQNISKNIIFLLAHFQIKIDTVFSFNELCEPQYTCVVNEVLPGSFSFAILALSDINLYKKYYEYLVLKNSFDYIFTSFGLYFIYHRNEKSFHNPQSENGSSRFDLSKLQKLILDHREKNNDL